MEDYMQRAQRRAQQRATSSWFKLVQGDNVFRILPTPASDNTPSVFYEYKVHREVGPRKVNVVCGKDIATDEGRCWLCDVQIPKLRKMGKVTRAAALEPKENLVLQVAKVEDSSFSGPFIFTPSKRVGDQIIASILGSKKRKYADAKNGYNLTINRTGTGKNDTRYGMIEPDVDPSEVPTDLVRKLKPFSELKEIGFYDEAKQKAAYTGADATDDEEEDDTEVEEAPTPKSSKSKPAPAPVEDDEDDEDDEVEAPPQPKKVKAESAKPKKVEVEEDDDDDEDDEPPVKPAPKAEAKPAPKKAAPKVEVEDEDDEDDLDIDSLDDDDDEDDEPRLPLPAKKKK